MKLHVKLESVFIFIFILRPTTTVVVANLIITHTVIHAAYSKGGKLGWGTRGHAGEGLRRQEMESRAAIGAEVS